MDRFEYKNIENAFSARKVLRQVEAYEREGWSLHSLESTHFFVFGSGGTAGLRAIMRRPLSRDVEAEDAP